MAKAATTNGKTVTFLKSIGVKADVVERFLPYARIRKDFLGFADIIGHNDYSVIAIQATDRTNRSHRIKKIKNISAAKKWLKSPLRKIWVITWAKRKRPDQAGRTREMWTALIDELYLDADGEYQIEQVRY